MSEPAAPRKDLLARLLGDWELRACARHGHATYRPDEPELAAPLQAMTPAGPAWRCLRCGTYVVGEPSGSGPADHAPEVPRGRLLRDLFVLRVLAVERGLRAVLLLLGGYAVYRFQGAQSSINDLVAQVVPQLRPWGQRIGWDPDRSWIVRVVQDAVHARPHTLSVVIVALVGYAALEAVEAVALWSGKRWGEYVAVIATSVFVPLEVYELVHHATVLKLVALAVNLFLVVWLVWSKRLFGLRGGVAAFRAEHATESLLTVQRAGAAG